MQRPRKYPSDPDRSAAYRERRESLTKRVDRKAVEALSAAVDAAAAAGDPVARQIKTGTVDGLLKNLAIHFERQARELAK
jgi:N-acetylglucosamine kinase-like BadF-type ATPase